MLDFSAPLQKLSALWGNTPPDWSVLESLERIEFRDDEFHRAQAGNLNLAILHELIEVFQDSLDFRINLGENQVFILTPDVTEKDLENFKLETRGSPTVRIYFRINKSRLIEKCFGDIYNVIPEPKNYYLYLFIERLIEYFKNSHLEELEKNVWKSKKDSTVIFLTPNTDCYLVGQRLGIFGGQYLTLDNVSELNGWSPKEMALANQAYSLCRENLKWQESWLNFITPWHLYILERATSPSELKKVFSSHFGNAFLLYTADFSFNQLNNGTKTTISRYSAPDKNVELICQEVPDLVDFSGKQEKLLSILNWIYDPQWTMSDRLTLAQHNIVDQLNLVDISNRFPALFNKAEIIRKNINWHWETFTKKKFDIYMGEVKDLEKYLSDVVNGYTTNIVMIQKALSDTMLAAVGVWIGTFIASLFDKPFNPFIFQAGLIGYSAYLLCFPLLYNMIQQWKGFIRYQMQIDARKTRFLEYLPSSKVEEIFQAWKVDDLKKSVRSNFWWTIGIYILVIFVSILGAIFLPKLEIIYSASQLPNLLITPTAIPAATSTLVPTASSTLVPTITPTLVPAVTRTLVSTLSLTITAIP